MFKKLEMAHLNLFKGVPKKCVFNIKICAKTLNFSREKKLYLDDFWKRKLRALLLSNEGCLPGTPDSVDFNGLDSVDDDVSAVVEVIGGVVVVDCVALSILIRD